MENIDQIVAQGHQLVNTSQVVVQDHQLVNIGQVVVQDHQLVSTLQFNTMKVQDPLEGIETGLGVVHCLQSTTIAIRNKTQFVEAGHQGVRNPQEDHGVGHYLLLITIGILEGESSLLDDQDHQDAATRRKDLLVQEILERERKDL